MRAVYAFCRATDDLGDEAPGDRLTARGSTPGRTTCAGRVGGGAPDDPRLAALADAIARRGLALDPFLRLIEANRMDQRRSRWETHEDLLEYCRHSATPVGEMVLGVLGYRDPWRLGMSDATCIGLQLVNFWQDVARDLRDRDRIYLPREDMDRLGVSEDDLRRAGRLGAGARADRARGRAGPRLPAGGRAAVPVRAPPGGARPAHVQRRRAGPVRRDRGPGLRHADPAAGPGEAGARPDRGGRGAADRRTRAPVTLALEEAYDACRDIAREEARNFYYGFILLPPERRAGIYAAYAFSRRADDSVDDEGSPAGKLAAVADRRDELDACYAGEPPADDPVLVALADTVRRFDVPRAHLDALLDGVAMDLTVNRYPDFPALKEYCDRVAGAVGLVSLHIFGFSDPRAPDHAADLGVAMQLVNIMRDVAEDAERDRIYLPGRRDGGPRRQRGAT